jgi:hypothetical protein
MARLQYYGVRQSSRRCSQALSPEHSLFDARSLFQALPVSLVDPTP